MNRQKSILFAVVLALLGGTAVVLAHAKSNQRLGKPGVKTAPLKDGQNLEVLLPADVPGYRSELVPQAAIVTNTLPPDTSYGQRLYTASDGFASLANVVLMGSSRGSIHDPQICLTAQGWKIDDAKSQVQQIPMDRPYPYDLPVMRMLASHEQDFNGQKISKRGIYIYWFVDGDRFTAAHSTRMLWMARDMLFRGELDRWAYISFFAMCDPGQEEATLGRMKRLITSAVPEFQLVPKIAK